MVCEGKNLNNVNYFDIKTYKRIRKKKARYFFEAMQLVCKYVQKLFRKVENSL